MEDTLSRVRPERVGQFTMTITSAQPSPDAEERWARRAETLTNWLLAAWRRDQAHVEGIVLDGQRPSGEDGHIRKCELN